VVPNFVDDNPPTGDFANRDKSLLLSVGAVNCQKRMDLLVQAVGDLPEHIRASVRLVLVGRGGAREELLALADKLNVNVELIDRMPHPDLMVLMRKASIYLQASAYEGHPLALIEAMSTGCPAIVANTPGLGNLVENGVNGIVVPGTPESLAYAVSGVLEDDPWREMLGSSAASSARRRFGLKTVMDSQTDALRAALRFACETRQAA